MLDASPYLSVLVALLVAFILGSILGGISGYYGGVVDEAIQRVIEVLISVPDIPIWIALSAALPRDWGTINIYFAITLILSIRGWAGLSARGSRQNYQFARRRVRYGC